VAQTLFSISPIALTLLSTMAVPATYRLPGTTGAAADAQLQVIREEIRPRWEETIYAFTTRAAVQSEYANLRKSIFSTSAKLSCIFFYSTPSVGKAVNKGRAFGM